MSPRVPAGSPRPHQPRPTGWSSRLLKRRPQALGAAAIMLLALSACGDADTIPAADAEAHYDVVMADVQTALTETGHPLTHAPDTRHFDERDGDCVYTPGTYQSTSLGDALNEAGGWDPVLEAVNPVLKEHGFSTRDAPEQEGAVLQVLVEDQYGAELSITNYGAVRIWGAHTDDAACATG